MEGLDDLFFIAEPGPDGRPVRRRLGGIPALGVYNVTGVPDTGKSILVEQFVLKQASLGRGSAFITVESPAPFVAAAMRARAAAMGIGLEGVMERILVLDAAGHAVPREELPTLLSTLAYAIRRYHLEVVVVDSITGLYEAREIQAWQVVRQLFDFLKKWRQTGLLVSQKRSGHEELSAEAAGGYAVAHIMDGTFVLSKRIIESQYDERLFGHPIGEVVRLFRIDGCRLAGHDPGTHLMEITPDGLVRIGPRLSGIGSRERR